jgi:hypothetical protein
LNFATQVQAQAQTQTTETETETEAEAEAETRGIVSAVTLLCSCLLQPSFSSCSLVAEVAA